MNLKQMVNTGSLWENEIKKEVKALNTLTLQKMGLTKEGLETVETLDELRKDPPNIVVAKSKKNYKFIQNWFKQQELRKNVSYVMGLGVYQQLHYHIQTKKKLLEPSSVRFSNIYKPYIGQELEDKTLLVFRTGGIGDLLFIQPNLRFLKEKYPSCKIMFACGPQYQAMVEDWDCIDEMLDLPFPLTKLIEADYHAIFEGVIERCKEAHTENAYRLFTKWLGLNLPDEKLFPIQPIKEDKLEECKNILTKWDVQKFILLQVRASSPIRTPNPNFWVKVINELTSRGYDVILTDTTRQSQAISDFIRKLDKPQNVYNFAQYSESLDYTIALSSMASVVVGTDSALMHIAAAVDSPCFGFYGPFPGEIRLTTYSKSDWVNAVYPCAPCFLHSMKICNEAQKQQLQYSPCYDAININESCDKIEKLIG